MERQPKSSRCALAIDRPKSHVGEPGEPRFDNEIRSILQGLRWNPPWGRSIQAYRKNSLERLTWVTTVDRILAWWLDRSDVVSEPGPLWL